MADLNTNGVSFLAKIREREGEGEEEEEREREGGGGEGERATERGRERGGDVLLVLHSPSLVNGFSKEIKVCSDFNIVSFNS